MGYKPHCYGLSFNLKLLNVKNEFHFLLRLSFLTRAKRYKQGLRGLNLLQILVQFLVLNELLMWSFLWVLKAVN